MSENLIFCVPGNPSFGCWERLWTKRGKIKWGGRNWKGRFPGSRQIIQSYISTCVTWGEEESGGDGGRPFALICWELQLFRIFIAYKHSFVCCQGCHWQEWTSASMRWAPWINSVFFVLYRFQPPVRNKIQCSIPFWFMELGVDVIRSWDMPMAVCQKLMKSAVVKILTEILWWWWLFPRLRGFWEKVRPFIPRLRFFFFFLKRRLTHGH